jgi:hypothetical protein
VEKTERLVKRYRSRKLLIPEQTELLKILDGMKEIDGNVDNAIQAANTMSTVFAV